ncbi:acyl-CoA reductase-like NAD-dependent aldehyde dehydrogenase [Roseovarius sp. MBR-51]
MSFAFDPGQLSLSKGHFIDGAYGQAADEIEVLSPSNGALIGAVPCADAEMVSCAREIADALAARLMGRFAQHCPAVTHTEVPGSCPIISERRVARIDAIVREPVGQGAEILCGGKHFDHEGRSYQPTLLAGVARSNPAVTEEISGPVAMFESFESDEETMDLARHPTYGPGAGVFTRDLSRAMRVRQIPEARTVWINRYGRSRDHILPTGGWTASGLGKDLGREAYLANRRVKSVLIDL